MEALLGSAAFGVSPLALPLGSSTSYMQPAGQRKRGKATLVKKPACAETFPTAREKVLFWLKLKAQYSINFLILPGLFLIRVLFSSLFFITPPMIFLIKCTASGSSDL